MNPASLPLNQQLDLLRRKFSSIVMQIKEQSNKNELVSNENQQILEEIHFQRQNHLETMEKAIKKLENLDQAFMDRGERMKSARISSSQNAEFIRKKDEQISELAKNLKQIQEIMDFQEKDIGNLSVNCQRLEGLIEEKNGEIKGEEERIGALGRLIELRKEEIRRKETEIESLEESMALKEGELTQLFTNKIRFEEGSRKAISDYREKIKMMADFKRTSKENQKVLAKKNEEYMGKCKRYDDLIKRNQLLNGKITKLIEEKAEFNRVLHMNNVIRYKFGMLRKKILESGDSSNRGFKEMRIMREKNNESSPKETENEKSVRNYSEEKRENFKNLDKSNSAKNEPQKVEKSLSSFAKVDQKVKTDQAIEDKPSERRFFVKMAPAENDRPVVLPKAINFAEKPNKIQENKETEHDAMLSLNPSVSLNAKKTESSKGIIL